MVRGRTVALTACLADGVIGATLAEIRRDVAAAQSRDPAAAGVGTLEILLAWPGVQALLAHRLANRLFKAGIRRCPRG